MTDGQFFSIMGPRPKGQTLNVFTNTDEITDLSVEHDRDNRGPPRPRGGPRDGGDGDWKSRGGGWKRDESEAGGAEFESSWRVQKPAGARAPSGYGREDRAAYGGGYGGREERGGFGAREDRGGYGSREDRGGSSFGARNREYGRDQGELSFARTPATASAAPASTFGKSQLSFLSGLMSKVDKERGPVAEPPRKAEPAAAVPAPSTATPNETSTKSRRWEALGDDSGFGGMRNRSDMNTDRRPFQSSGMTSGTGDGRRMDMSSSGLTKPTAYTADKMRRNAEQAVQERRDAAERREREEVQKREAEAAEALRKEQDQKREAAKEAARAAEAEKQRELEAAQERKAYEKKVHTGGLLVGSTTEVRALVSELRGVFEGERTAEEAVKAAMENESFRESTLPLAVSFALYVRKLLDMAEDIADELESGVLVSEEEVLARMTATAQSSCTCLAALLKELASKSAFKDSAFTLCKMQELARILTSCGLGRMTPNVHLVDLAYSTLLQREVISKDELLEWYGHAEDKCEKRTDALARCVMLVRQLKGLAAPAAADDEAAENEDSGEED